MHYVDLLRKEEPEKRLLKLTGLYYSSARNFVLSRVRPVRPGRAERATLLSADIEARRPLSARSLLKEGGRMGEQKKAIVVGVGAEVGVGRAVCHRLAREGLHVFIAGRTQERLDHLARSIQTNGGTATGVVTDTTQEPDVLRLFDTAENQGDGVLDCVVYNAGNNFPKPLLETEAEFFEKVWRVGCLGGFLVGREAGRRMIPRGRGTIIFYWCDCLD